MNIEDIDFSLIFPVIVVAIAFLIAWVATTISGLSDRTTLTRYTEVVGESKYQPDSWVFSVAWAFIYIGYVIFWTGVNYYFEDNKTRKYLNGLLGVGMALNILWSLFIIYGSIDSKVSPKTGYWGSTITLVAIIALNIYTLVFIRRNLHNNSNLRLLGSILFVVYALWAIIATFLSLTSEPGPLV